MLLRGIITWRRAGQVAILVFIYNPKNWVRPKQHVLFVFPQQQTQRQRRRSGGWEAAEEARRSGTASQASTINQNKSLPALASAFWILSHLRFINEWNRIMNHLWVSLRWCGNVALVDGILEITHYSSFPLAELKEKLTNKVEGKYWIPFFLSRLYEEPPQCTVSPLTFIFLSYFSLINSIWRFHLSGHFEKTA